MPPLEKDWFAKLPDGARRKISAQGYYFRPSPHRLALPAQIEGGKSDMGTPPVKPAKGAPPERRRYTRIERRFSTQRSARELVRDLLRAHSGE